MTEIAGRTDFWNIGYPMLGAIVYLVAPISIAFIAYALYRRVQFWRVGAAYDELGSHRDRIREFLRAGAFGFGGHGKFHPRRERYASVMHFAIFWGFGNPIHRDNRSPQSSSTSRNTLAQRSQRRISNYKPVLSGTCSAVCLH